MRQGPGLPANISLPPLPSEVEAEGDTMPDRGGISPPGLGMRTRSKIFCLKQEWNKCPSALVPALQDSELLVGGRGWSSSLREPDIHGHSQFPPEA